MGVHWRDWCWTWNSSILATWFKEVTHLKRPWYWERMKAGEEGDDRGWDGWMASLTQWRCVWVNSESWWWTGKPGVLQSTGSQRVGHDWATELNWTEAEMRQGEQESKPVSWLQQILVPVPPQAWLFPVFEFFKISWLLITDTLSQDGLVIFVLL